MAWQLLGRLPLSPQLIEEIVLFNKKNEGWDEFLNPAKKYKLLYTLPIMEFLMESEEIGSTKQD